MATSLRGGSAIVAALAISERGLPTSGWSVAAVPVAAVGSACRHMMKLLLLTLLLSLAVDSANSCKSDLDCAHVTSPRPSHSRSANAPAALAS